MIAISTDKSLLNSAIIHGFLTKTYWAKGRTLKEVQKTIDNSLCFGVYLNGNQIGFARIVTDYVVYAYVMDVFILPGYRGKGYSMQLLRALMNEPKLQGCKGWMLKTRDTHGLYEQFGFSIAKYPDNVMERITT